MAEALLGARGFFEFTINRGDELIVHALNHALQHSMFGRKIIKERRLGYLCGFGNGVDRGCLVTLCDKKLTGSFDNSQVSHPFFAFPQRQVFKGLC